MASKPSRVRSFISQQRKTGASRQSMYHTHHFPSLRAVRLSDHHNKRDFILCNQCSLLHEGQSSRRGLHSLGKTCHRSAMLNHCFRPVSAPKTSKFIKATELAAGSAPSYSAYRRTIRVGSSALKKTSLITFPEQIHLSGCQLQCPFKQFALPHNLIQFYQACNKLHITI